MMKIKNTYIFLWFVFAVMSHTAIADVIQPFAVIERTKFETDLSSGNATFAVPIESPPARGKAGVNLFLGYSSARGNGWCGMGWDVPVAYIQRDTRKGPPAYTEEDSFIAVFPHGAIELVKIRGSEYRAKTESLFMRFKYNVSSNIWSAADKDGTIYYFGSGSNSRKSGDLGVFSWHLDKVMDTQGNYTHIKYANVRGEIYLRKIEYTGNDNKKIIPKYSIIFNLETRDDASSSFRSSLISYLDRRLKSIEVVECGRLIRRYELSYEYSADTRRSLLKQIIQVGSDGKSTLPPVKFFYSKSAGMALPELPEMPAGDNLWSVRSSIWQNPPRDRDFIAYPVKSNSLPDEGYIAEDSAFGEVTFKWSKYSTDVSRSSPGLSWQQEPNGNIKLQGKAGAFFHLLTFVYMKESKSITLALSREGHVACFHNGGLLEPRYTPQINLQKGLNVIEFTGYFTRDGSVDLGLPLAEISGAMNSKLYKSGAMVGDYNADGLLDISRYYRKDASWEVSLGKQDGFQGFNKWLEFESGVEGSLERIPLVADFNADGRADAALYKKSRCYVAFSEGDKFKRMPSLDFSTPEGTTPLMSDFNGDNLPELSAHGGWSSPWFYQYDRGSDKFVNNLQLDFETFSSTALVSGDFNGDGLTDIGRIGADEETWRIFFSAYLSYGRKKDRSAFSDSHLWISDFGSRHSYQNKIMFADFNNDGMTDMGYFSESTGDWHIALSDGTRFVPSGIWIRDFGAGGAWAPLVADFNGDGLTDAALISAFDKNKAVVAYARGAKPDLLFEIDNGVGSKTLITYVPSTRYENEFLPFAVHTVSEVTIMDGQGNKHTTKYEYSGGLYDIEERELRGFKYVKAISPEGSVTETWMKQDDIYKGKIEKQIVSDINGKVYKKIENEWRDRQVASGVSFLYLFEERVYSYDGDETYKVSATQYEYDDYGNITLVKNLGELEKPGDEKEEVREYAYNINKWIVNRPKHTIIKDTFGSKIAESRFYYDESADINAPPDKGDLTLVEKWHNGGENVKEQNVYDEFGNVVKKIDARGSESFIEYDHIHRQFPVKTTNALGQSEYFEYDYGFGKVAKHTDTNGNVSRIEFDVFGRPGKEFGPGDKDNFPRKIYRYDLRRFPNSTQIYSRIEANKPGYLREYVFYDGLGRVVERKVYAADTSKQIIQDAVVYDSRGLVIQRVIPYFERSRGVLYTQPDLSKPRVRFQYDVLGRLTRTMNADSTVSYTVFSDWEEAFVDENGHQKKTQKDAFGNIVSVAEYNKGGGYITTYEYDALNNLRKIIDAKGNVSESIYDSLGRKVVTIDPDMGRWVYAYDGNGNLVSQTDAKGQMLRFKYDALNRLVEKGVDLATLYSLLATYFYDDKSHSNSVGRLSKVSYPDGSDEYHYDEQGNTIRAVKTVGGASFLTAYEYDLLNRIKRMLYPDGEIINYAYNAQSQVQSIKGASDYVKGVQYNASDQIASLAYGNSVITTYGYNPLNLRLENITTAASRVGIQNLTYEFDKVGNIAKITDAVNSQVQDFRYDDLDRLTYARGAYGEIGYHYDEIGNMLQKGNVILQYGQRGGPAHAVTSTNDGLKADQYAYDANGNLTSDGSSIYAYDIENRLTGVNEQQVSQTSFTFNLSSGFNFISFPLIPDSSELDTILSALTPVSDYDELLRYKPDTGSFEGYFHNEFNQFSRVEYGRGYQIHITNPQGARLTITGTPANPNEGIPLSRGWNLIGLPTTRELTVKQVLSAVPYDDIRAYNSQTNQLQKLSEADTLTPGKSYFIHCLQDTMLILPESSTQPSPAATFAYDADGRRLKKTDSSGTTIYIGGHYEVGPQGATKHIFMGNRRICSIESRSSLLSTRYFHSDHLGSTSLITNEQGEIIERSEYKPYGEFSSPSQPTTRPTTHNSSSPTNYYYTGKELDSTGLYYYGARYYSPAVGRFTQPDSIVQAPYDPQSLNRYAYTRNNPLRYTDPTGQSWEDIRNTTMSIFRQSQQWISNTISSFNTSIIQPMVSIAKEMRTANSSLNTISNAGFISDSDNQSISNQEFAKILGKIGSYVYGASATILKQSIPLDKISGYAPKVLQTVRTFKMAAAATSALSYVEPFQLAASGKISIEDATRMTYVKGFGNVLRVAAGGLGSLGGGAIGEWINPVGGGIPGAIIGSAFTGYVADKFVISPLEKTVLEKWGIRYD